MIAGGPDRGMAFSLSAGNVSDYRAGRELIERYDFPDSVEDLVMDKGYSFYETREACAAKSLNAVMPPKSNFRDPWPYNKNVYLYRNEIERLFHRLKNYRRIATRYDKLDASYSGFILLGMIALILKVIC